MIDTNEAIKDVTKAVDDAFTTRDEYNEQSTNRLVADTTSPFKLPHLIRPILGIWTMSLQTIIVAVGLIASKLSFEAAMEANAVLVGAVFLFYFGSRGFEKVFEQKGKAQIRVAQEQAKVEAKKAEAAIKIEEIKTKADIRAKRKVDRKAAKEERKEGD